MIYASLFGDKKIALLSLEARLLYVGLITLADDDGRLEGDPVLLKSKLFPRDADVNPSDVEKWIQEVEKAELIVLYEVRGENYIQHPNWTKYQSLRADRKKESLIPPPDDNQPSTNSPSDGCHDAAEDKVSKDKVSKEKISELFARFWSSYPNKTGKKKAEDKWTVILRNLTEKDALSLFDEIIAGLDRAKKSKQWLKDNGEFIPHPITWLNQERWNDEGVKSTFATGGTSDKFKGVGKTV